MRSAGDWADRRRRTKNNAWLHNRTAALNLRRLLNLGLDHQNGTWVIA